MGKQVLISTLITITIVLQISYIQIDLENNLLDETATKQLQLMSNGLNLRFTLQNISAL